uniref:Uncharacterized protein n=1 Tax=Rhizophora mucronata TaxID=61149 RepID=A0A2P2QXJ7_RHIMU
MLDVEMLMEEKRWKSSQTKSPHFNFLVQQK